MKRQLFGGVSDFGASDFGASVFGTPELGAGVVLLIPGVGVAPLPGGVGVDGVGTEPLGFGASAGLTGGVVVLPGAGVVVVGGELEVGVG